jgi:hypothetical protein
VRDPGLAPSGPLWVGYRFTCSTQDPGQPGMPTPSLVQMTWLPSSEVERLAEDQRVPGPKPGGAADRAWRVVAGAAAGPIRRVPVGPIPTPATVISRPNWTGHRAANPEVGSPSLPEIAVSADWRSSPHSHAGVAQPGKSACLICKRSVVRIHSPAPDQWRSGSAARSRRACRGFESRLVYSPLAQQQSTCLTCRRREGRHLCGPPSSQGSCVTVRAAGSDPAEQGSTPCSPAVPWWCKG